MKTIKVFLASSEELEYERLKLDQAIRELNKNIYNKKDVNIDLFMWEMHDRQYRTEAKQEEYNKCVRESDMFLGLFWTKAGKFTLEEFNIAHKQFQESQKAPALFVFFKEIEPNKEDETLKIFKDKLLNNLSHYASNFCSIEKVKYEFLEEFLRLEICGAFGGIRVVDGVVMYDDYKICNISALPFAANNVDRTQLIETIEKLRARIKKLTARAEDDDDWADIRAKKVELESAEKELERHDEALIHMSIDYARRASNESSATLLEAREAFRQGKMQRVRELTKVSDIDRRIEVKREYEKALNDDFELLLISRNAIIADISIPIEQRIAEVCEAYERLMVLLKELNKEMSLHAEIIFDYAHFADKYAKYEKAKELYLENIDIRKELYGDDSKEIVISYNNTGLVYYNQGDYSKALEYYKKALVIEEKVLGTEHPNTATIYDNIGSTYYQQKALEYYKKTLGVEGKVLDTEHPDTAISYNNIGVVFSNRDYSKALEYHEKALTIRENVLDAEHPDIARSYNNIGSIYEDQGDHSKALKYFKKALVIEEKVLGTEHPNTATSYNNIGLVYSNQGDYSKALEYYEKALTIREYALGAEHPDIARSYNNIGFIYKNRGDYSKALEYYKKALTIRENILGTEHPDTAVSYINIRSAYYYQGNKFYNQGNKYYNQGDYNKAIEYYLKTIEIRETVFNDNYTDLANFYNSISNAYYMLNDYESSLLYCRKRLDARLKISDEDSSELATCYASIGYLTNDNEERLNSHNRVLKIRLNILGRDNLNTAQSYFDIADAYIALSEYQKSIEHLNKALEIRIKLLGMDSEHVAICYNNIGYVYNEMGRYQEALESHLKSLAIKEKVLGSKDLKTVTSYHHLGKTYNYLGEYATALEWLNKALPIRERELGEDNEQTVATRKQFEIAKAKLNSLNE